MERHEILEAMSAPKLYGMRASFDEIAGKGLARRDEIYPLIASLIRAERTQRQARSISCRIGGAKSPVHDERRKGSHDPIRGLLQGPNFASAQPIPTSLAASLRS
jgi:hypothetical protein